MKTRKFLALFLLIYPGLALASGPHDEGNLQGKFFTGRTWGGDIGKGKNNYFIWLEGSAAETLFNQIPGTASKEKNLDNVELMVKSASNIECRKRISDKSYECDFGIDLSQANLISGHSE